MSMFLHKLNYFTDRLDFPELKFAWDINSHARVYALADKIGIQV